MFLLILIKYLMLCLCFKCEPGLKKTHMHVVRQTAFYCYCLNTASLPQIQFIFYIFHYSNLSDKLNDDPQFCAAHSPATRCLTNINKLRDPSICQPKKHEPLAQEESQRLLKFGKSSLFGLLIFEKH